MNLTCLHPPTEPRKLVNFRGVERPLGIVTGNWASAVFLSNILIILAREVLNYDISISARLGSSAVVVEALIGSSYAGAHDISLEVWTSPSIDTLSKYDEWQRPASLGAPGYEGFEGLFLPRAVEKDARQHGDYLLYHLTYSAPRHQASRYFDLYSTFSQEMMSRNLTVISCAEDQMLALPSYTAGFYLQHTGDSDGVENVPNVSNPDFRFKCTDFGTGVWFSPSCRQNISECIPVASNVGWGITNVGLSQKYAHSKMPVAVINFDEHSYRQAPFISRMLFYGWVPDATFSDLDPVQVSFPAHDPAEWEQGIRYTSQLTGNVRKMVRHDFEADAPVNVMYMLQRFMISQPVVNGYLKQWPKESRDPAKEEKEFEVACKWIQENSGTWHSWKLQACAEGFYAPADETKVCIPCPLRYYCPPLTYEVHMKKFQTCPPNYWCPNSSAYPQTCTNGWYLDDTDHTCNKCPAGRYSPLPDGAHSSTECLECSWSWTGLHGVNSHSIGCSFQYATIITVTTSLVVLLVIGCKFRKRLLMVVEDRPDRPDTFSGSWVCQWIGSFMQEQLEEPQYDWTVIHRMESTRESSGHSLQGVASMSRFSWSRVSAWMSTRSGSAFGRVRIVEEIYFRCRACLKRCKKKARCKEASQLLRRPDFIVNATPFDIHVDYRRRHTFVQSFSFQRVNRISRNAIKISVSCEDGDMQWQRWMPRLEEPLIINLDKADWEKASLCRGGVPSAHLKKIVKLYDNKVIRCPMTANPDEPRGEIKVVWRRHKVKHSHGEVLLITWSPPHIYRAIPIPEFLTFLDKVMNHKDSWTSKKTKQPKLLASRNMYDANRHYLQNEATCYDASYAEIRTFYGPADIFISHVWSETAENTRRSLMKYCDLLVDPDRSDRYSSSRVTSHMSPSGAKGGSVLNDSMVSSWNVTRGESTSSPWNGARGSPVSTISTGQIKRDESNFSLNRIDRDQSTASVARTMSTLGRVTRVWFCTCSNNQARVAEELGHDIQHSPFARVLRSTQCTKVLLISPLKALERKWCNYEFSQAVLEGKEPLMVTKDGVVQAGQVSPKYLNELSAKMISFRCSQSQCSSVTDEALIDEAVEKTGGYKELDKRLKKIFHDAIVDAHAFTEMAMRTMQTLDELHLESLSQLCICGDTSLDQLEPIPSAPSLTERLRPSVERNRAKSSAQSIDQLTIPIGSSMDDTQAQSPRCSPQDLSLEVRSHGEMHAAIVHGQILSL